MSPGGETIGRGRNMRSATKAALQPKAGKDTRRCPEIVDLHDITVDQRPNGQKNRWGLKRTSSTEFIRLGLPDNLF